MATHTRRAAVLMAAVAGIGTGVGCEDPELSVPSVEQARSYYSIPSESSVTVRGNVVEVVVHQSPEDLARGGRLWARVGPYVYLFSEPTRRLFDEHAGLAAVRVVTRGAEGEEVARATLRRDALNAVTWPRALNIAGLARRDGTERPTLLEDLVNWGQEHTTYEYSEDFPGSP